MAESSSPSSSGRAVLVFFAVGVATLMFGFKFDGGSVAAGVVATALAFGLILLGLAYVLGPISGGHVNPAVTLGALLAGRMPADRRRRLLGGPVRRGHRRAPCVLWAMFSTSPLYHTGPIQGWAPTATARPRRSTSGSAGPSWPRSS